MYIVYMYVWVCGIVWESVRSPLNPSLSFSLLFIHSVVYHSLSISFGVVDVSVFISLALKTQLSTAAVEQHIYYQLNGYYYSSFVRFSFSIFKQTNNFHFLLYFLIFLIRVFFGRHHFTSAEEQQEANRKKRRKKEM